jgi:hypothetical protein
MTTVKYWRLLAANPYTGLSSLCKISEIHEIGGVRHQIYQQITFCGQLAELFWIPELWINYYSQTLYF